MTHLARRTDPATSHEAAARVQTTQAQQIVQALRGQWLTYGELEALRISTCPWKRLSEAGHRFLRPGEKIKRRTGDDGLVRISVMRCGRPGVGRTNKETT